ncbi:MAG: serine/threonine-protein kinase [Acidobacteriota bacterium]
MISGNALVGITLADQYQVLTRIHTGSAATVYRGYDLRNDRPVAIKAISQHELGKHHDAVLRFRREIVLLSQIQHPNIIKIYSQGETSYGIAYFVMQWLEGRTLLDELDNIGQMPLTRIQAIFTPVCEAVSAMHAAAILHRDLKPGNIFLSRNADGSEHTTLLDFGLARPLLAWQATEFEISGKGVALGTPEYMSPEQCNEQELTPASDIYSLGVVLYRMLAGRLPFVGEAQYVMTHHIASPLPPLHVHRPHLSEAVVAVVRQALAKHPAERFASVLDLRLALDAAVAGTTEDYLYRRPQPPETDRAGESNRTRNMPALSLGPDATESHVTRCWECDPGH